MNLKEIRELVKFAKKQGILKLKLPDLEIELDPQGLAPRRTRTKKSDKDLQDKPQYSDMDALLWSVPDLDPLKERMG